MLAFDEGDAAERVAGPDRNTGEEDAAASELRYGWWMSLKENGGKSSEPPDIPWTYPLPPPPPPPESRDDDDVSSPVSHASPAPIIHIIADSPDTTSTLSPPPISSPLPVDRPITPRGVDENMFSDVDGDLDAESDWIFNIIIQQQRKQRSAYIAPDVNWLRDLVPKVVEVVDQSETQIKETVFSAIDDDKIVEAGHIEDRQIFVNVVKSRVESETEVPRILTHLRDLMQTGGPAVDSIRSESRDIHDRRPNSLIINIIIFNVVADLAAPTTEKPLNPTAIFRDSYIEALEESRNPNRKATTPAVNVATTAAPHHHHHHTKNPSQAKPQGPAKQSSAGPSYTAPKGGPYFIKGQSVSSGRPQTIMEKDYLRPSKTGIKSTSIHLLQPVIRPVLDAHTAEEDMETAFFDSEPDLTSVGAGLTLTGPQPPAPPDDDGPQPPAPPIEEPTPTSPKPPTTTKAPTRRPGNRIPSAVGSIASTAGNVVRNRVRTMGLVGVPLMAGLAGTASFWLPAVAALGRKKRSVEDANRERAIDDPNLLALLMGKRYYNLTKESLQESIDNWKNRDQEAGYAVVTPSQNRLSSTSRPLWFLNQRTSTTAKSTTVKRSTDSIEDGMTTRKSPVFYSSSSVFDEEEEVEGSEPEEEEIEGREEFEPEEEEIEGREEEEADLSEYSEVPNTSSTTTTTSDYDTEETSAREANPVTVSVYNKPSGGFDFDIVANFVRSTLSKMATESTDIKENLFHIKSPSIVSNITKSTKPFSTLLFKNSANRAPSSGGASTQPLTVFTADPIMPNRSDEKVTNSPVTYVSMSAKPPAKTTSTSTTSAEYSDTSGSDIPSSENVGVPLEFYDEDGSTYYSKEVLGQTVPYSEPFVKSTSKPMPAQFVLNPFELPNTLRPVTAEEMMRISTTGSTRPSSLLTIADFKTARPPAPVDVSSTGAITTLKFNHGGIVTTPPLQDFSTLTGESSLVSDTVDKQNILNGLFKGASAVPGDGQTDQPGSSSSTLGDTGLNGMYVGSFNTATYDPFSPTGVSDELDVTSLISQLQTNLTTGLVTRPPTGGLHFVNTSTDIVIINPFSDVTPSSFFGPLGIEPVVAEDSVIVDASDASPGDLGVEAVPPVSNLANFFFPVVSSSSSDSSSSSSSSSSVSSSGGSNAGFITSLSATSGIGSLASLGVLAVATIALLAVSLPIWVPLVGKKKRRTYGPARKKAKKPPPKKTYGPSPPKKTYGEPPLNHYKDLDERIYDNEMIHQPSIEDIYRAEPSGPTLVANEDDDYVFRDSIPLNTDTLFSDPGPLDSEDIYGPPATIFLNSRRRRRSTFE